jgi:hypothetical protein
MTGLKPDTDRIIEIATLVTDSQLQLLAEGPVFAIHQDEATLARMDEWNQRQHGSSGLLARVRASRVTEAEAEAAYEKLCLFYVAMTRAKQALYLFTKPVSEKSKSDNFPRLLTETLGTAGTDEAICVGNWSGVGAYAKGDGDWFAASKVSVAVEAGTMEPRGIEPLETGLQVIRHPARRSRCPAR